MSRKGFISALLVALSLLLPVAGMCAMGGSKMLNPGAVAPDFQFDDLTGKKTSLYQTETGKPVMLVFVQTACRSCQREMAFIKELADKGTTVKVLIVFVDLKERDFTGFMKENTLPFQALWDKDYKISDTYGVAFTPASYLLDGERKIAKVYRGWTGGGQELEADLKAIGAMK